ncbi:thioredoxin-like protein [Mucilaginibacter frigoritolerans]|uniref:Thioredoxin-like protein n=1 Tax=Mucilaginibacter frigoritolerans TaxID=652788 RepID=A0A562U6V8_9SPHI|nr:vitamin K epoxide reductase family protein [Mucilaginibacter frigoritolerans]TWJ01536.1 thioredoxin-like protein [Mucilaginibacter frigoritolerans]
MLSFTKHPNAEAAVFKLLKYLKINIEPELISSEMFRHPDYPSMLAISDVLNALNIENAAFRVEAEEIDSVPCPFIAYAKSNGGEFWVVTEINKDFLLVSSEKWEKHKLETEAFKKIFGGIVLTAEPSNAFTKTTTFATFLSEFKTLLLAIGLLLVLASALVFHSTYFTTITWQSLALALFKTAGLVTSVLLLIQSIDGNNPLIQKLCQNKGKTNCNAILSSKAAKVFDWLTWSEVGFFYFSGTWLLLLFSNGSTAIWQVLALLNLVSLPYTFYSIYYQARVAKKWCVLCCTVQALLWLEFVPLLSVAFKSPLIIPDAGVWSAVIISFLLPIILWAFVKPLFLEIQQLPPLKKQLRTFKYNNDLFNQLLTSQPKYAQPDEEWSIVLGNVEANNIITMVTNPYCPPCSATHKLLDDLLNQNGDIQARIVFTAQNIDDDIKTPVSRHLMALNANADKANVKQALHDWYEQKQKNYNEWAKIYPVQLNEADFYKLDKQHEWCQMAEVTATPTLLLNGYRLPQIYQLPDLKYMLQ